MKTYSGTLAGVTTGFIVARQDKSSALFTEYGRSHRAAIKADGSYSLTLPYGKYLVIVTGAEVFVPDFKITASAGAAGPLPFPSKKTKGEPVSEDVTKGGGGSGSGPVLGDGAKMIAKQTSAGVWEFTVDGSITPAEPVPTTVSIPASKMPGFTDGPGTNDTVTLFSVPGVKWRVQSPPNAVGTEYGSTWFGGTSSKSVSVTSGGAAEVTAIAEPGYVLSGNAAWSHNFTNTQAATKVTIPTGSYPQAVDVAGMASDKVVLSKVTGVTWTVDGTDHPSSGISGATKDVPYAKGVDTVVTAKPSSSDYEISGTASWALQFTNATTPSGGWTSLFAPVTLSGVADGALTAGTVLGGNGTTLGAKVTKGAPRVASEAITFPTGADCNVAILSGADRNKARFSFTYKGGSEPYKRQHVVLSGAAGQGIEVGLSATGPTSFTLSEGITLQTQQPTASGAQITVPIGSKVTIEWDGPTNTMTVLVNDAIAGTFTPSKTVGNVKNLMFAQSGYCTTALTIDDLHAESWVA